MPIQGYPDRQRIRPLGKPERYTEIDREVSPGTRKSLPNIHRWQLRVLRKTNLDATGHDGVQALEAEPHALEFIVGDSCLHEPIRIREAQLSLRSYEVIHPLLQTLEVMRLEEETFVPVDL